MPKKPSEPVTTTGPTRPVGGANPAPAAAPLAPTAKAAPATAATPVARAGAVAPVRPSGAVSPTERVTGAARSGAVRLREISERLRRGELSADQAVAALIDDAVRDHEGSVSDPALSEKLRAALQAHVESDPELSARARRLQRAGSPRKERA